MDIDIDFKVDSYFMQWIFESPNNKLFNEISLTAKALLSGTKRDFDFNIFNEQVRTSSHPQPKLPGNVSIQPQKTQQITSAPQETISKSLSSLNIKPFYNKEDGISEYEAVSAKLSDDQISPKILGEILDKHCKLPNCFAPIIIRKRSNVRAKFLKFYKEYIAGKSSNEKFFNFISGGNRNYIKPSELTPYVQAIVQSHSSLSFLANEDQFQEKFIEFIVTRCFYQMDPELRGIANIKHFKRYNIAQVFYNAHTMPDINEEHHIFNYQHFYVAFCKFWDLDADNDNYLSIDDLMKLNESTISPLIIENFFKLKVYPRDPTRENKIDFAEFSYFLMSSEDKTNQTAINLMFKLCDLDEDGKLSMSEIEKLYLTQYEQIKLTGNEAIPFDDIQKQLVDMIGPSHKGYFTVNDLRKSKQADLFFNTLVDIQKFLTREYQFPLNNLNFDEATKGLTPWEIYVLIEYEQLANDQG